jgi:hypothetical protein
MIYIDYDFRLTTVKRCMYIHCVCCLVEQHCGHDVYQMRSATLLFIIWGEGFKATVSSCGC